jgi:hypothetical protein
MCCTPTPAKSTALEGVLWVILVHGTKGKLFFEWNKGVLEVHAEGFGMIMKFSS